MRTGFGLALDFWSTTKPLNRHLDDCAKLLALAETYDFNSVWAGENRPPRLQPGHTPSPLLILAALANRTTLRIGTGVTLLALWHPLRLAYDGAMLDHLSDGRFTLGVGLGTPPVMQRFGVPSSDAGSRMDDALRFLKAMWSGADRYYGPYFQVEGRVIPGPVQPDGPPIWVGGTVGSSVRRAAELGDGWYGATQYHFEMVRRQAQRYREHVAACGRVGSPMVAINRTTFLAPTDAAAQREGRAYIEQVLSFYARIGALTDAEGRPLGPDADLFELVGDNVYFAGSPNRCVESLERYIGVGVNQFNFRVGMANIPLPLVERTVRLLGEQVLPRFR
jgi:alkanesulfonate monooxygenase SsuD/methylene tetrahydromethanopterin reductase-like flavin-dependent oxidoreductase (luciferase family)